MGCAVPLIFFDVGIEICLNIMEVTEKRHVFERRKSTFMTTALQHLAVSAAGHMDVLGPVTLGLYLAW